MEPATTAALIMGGSTLASGLLGGKGGGDPSVQYTQSPQQAQMYQQLLPIIQAMTRQVTTGEPAYDIPPTEMLMPTRGWYGDISPEIKEAAWEPYMEGMDILGERLGGIGMFGSQRGGMSGAAADIFSRYMRDVTPTVASQLWGMTQPGLQAGWQAELGREQMPFMNAPGMMGGTYPTGMVTPQAPSPWAQGIQAGGMTYAMPQIIKSMYPMPTTQPQTPYFGYGSSAAMPTAYGGAGYQSVGGMMY